MEGREMTEFTKTKMHFALALLGTLFAVHPFVEKLEHLSFDYLSWRLEVFHAYGLTAGLLAVAIYCYAAALVSEKPASKIERMGNYCYAISILIFPLYGGLFLAHLLERWLDESRLLAGWLEPSQLQWAGPIAAAALGCIWLVAWQVLAWHLRGRLSDQDRFAKVDQLADEEMAALNRATEMLAGHHYDLSVIEGWKALEARLRRSLIIRGQAPRWDSAEALIATASKTGLLREPSLARVQDVRRQWSIAIGPEPLGQEAAEKALQEVRDILSTISLNGPEMKNAA
jgi:hypothetical protein